MKKWIVYFWFGAVSLSGKAQDVVFSQTDYSTQFLNPARLSADLPSVNIHYRMQPTQISPSDFFLSTAASLNYPLRYAGHEEVQLSLGTSFFHSQQVLGLNTYGGIVGLAYRLPFERASLSFGLQAGLMQSVIRDDIITANQFDPHLGTFNLNFATGEENLSQTSNVYSTLGMGLYFSSFDHFKREKFYLGISGLNANQPAISFQGERVNAPSLAIDWNIIGGYYLTKPRLGAWSIRPDFRWLHRGGNDLLQIGSQFSCFFKNDAYQLALGSWYRSNQTVVLAVDFRFNQYHASFSYDLPTQGEASLWIGNGGLEFTLGILLKRKKNPPLDNMRLEPVVPIPYEAYFVKPELFPPKIPLVSPPPSNPYTDDIPPDKNGLLGIGEALIDPPIKRVYYTEATDFSDFDWQSLDHLLNLINTYPKTNILIVGEVQGLASQVENDASAYELAKKVKGYVMMHTSLREDDIVIQFNKPEKPVLDHPAQTERKGWGVRIESIIQE